MPETSYAPLDEQKIEVLRTFAEQWRDGDLPAEQAARLMSSVLLEAAD